VTTNAALDKARPLSLGEVTRIFRVTPKTLMKWVAQGRFPKPFRPGERHLYWSRETIEKALREAEAEEAGK
jgi:predicted DNA-binding transcriptional regulator AlpA